MRMMRSLLSMSYALRVQHYLASTFARAPLLEVRNCIHFCLQSPQDRLTRVVVIVLYALITGFTSLRLANGHVSAKWTCAHWRSPAFLVIDTPTGPPAAHIILCILFPL
jgi:hypothetical protein